MNELSQFLVESILGEADSVDNIVVVYAGRFQPFHKGHYATYSHLVKKFGKDNVYIGTSNKTDNQKSPFNFKEKKEIMTTMFGVPSNKIVEVKNPYQPTEVMSKFDKDTTAFITVVGKKDASRLGGKYFEPYKDGKELEGYRDKGYVYIAPEGGGGVSGTEVRMGLRRGSDEDKKEFFTKRAYGKFNPKIFKFIAGKLAQLPEITSENIWIPKHIVENWLISNVELIKEASSIIGKTEVDDGPNFLFPSFSTFDRISKRRAEKIGMTVLSQIMSDELTDIDPHPIYPKGPVKAVTPFPAGVIGKTTATNQKDFYGSVAYNKWFKHVSRVASLVGYSLVDSIELETNKIEAEKTKKIPGVKLPVIKEDITIPVNIGDTILMGKFKNKKVVVKSIGKDEYGMPTINGKKVATFRMIKEGKEIEFNYLNESDIVKLNNTLGIERGELPQIPKDSIEEYLGYLESNKIPFEIQSQPVASLNSSQTEIDLDKVRDMMTDEDVNNTPIIVSKDDYILDGHHRALAAFNSDKESEIPVIKIDLPIDELIEVSNDFNGSYNQDIDEDLRNWFGKGKTGSKDGGGWDRYNTSGEKVGKCGDAKEGEPYAACLSQEKAKKLGKDGIAAFVKRKRAAQKKAGDAEKGGEQKKGQKPTYVKTGASEGVVNEENVPTNPTLWDKAIAAAKRKYDVYPSAYANAFASKWYKDKGGKWKTEEGTINEIPMADLVKIDSFADKQLNPVDVVLTDKHFFDRLNDPRNGKEISNAELIGFFKRLGKNKKKFVEFLNQYNQIVAKDNRTNINIPFMKQANKVIAKTIMRKSDFKTSSPEYEFEAKKNDEFEYNEPYALGGGISEANAVSGGKVHKYITGKNLTLKGKKYSDIEFEVLGIDNKTQIVKLKVLYPKNLFGHEINIDFRTLRRGPFLKTNTKITEMIRLKELLNEVLLTEGGAYGHMNHPFDTEINLTFGQLKDIVNKALEGNLELTREKTDGQALAISWVNGRLVAARNKGHLKNKGAGALDINGVAMKFAGRGELEKAYNFAMKDLSKAISKLSEKQREKIFKGGACFMNLEVIYPTSVNVIPYGQALLVFHGTMEYNEDGIAIGENQEAARILAGMIKQINADVQSAYTIQGPPVVQLPKSKNLSSLKGKYNGQISKLQSQFKLKDTDGVSEYHQAWWVDFVTKKSPSTLDNKTLMGLVKRWAFYDKSFRLDNKNITDEKTLEWAQGIDKNDHAKMAKDNIRPFEDIFLGVGAEVLSFMSSALTANPDKAVRDMKKRLDQTIKDVQQSGDPKKVSKLKLELERLNAIGGKDKIVPNEGIVFVYGGKTFKLTGTFAPLNQILGLFYE